ncbi:hypothetical protein F5144DRAFT_614638 [Chaetomium tenue]|uniref:Uncharacterized protein n=1 Tax=Chaetomium tenue TaxID=1854479 RepID=A0ACB7NWN3_9PEZI|nr:hypothetical protein F5144DRAFT_614638 [Chaetomium globosum]
MDEDREQEADPDTALAGILQGFRIVWGGPRKLWVFVRSMTPSTAVTFLTCLLVIYLGIGWFLTVLWGVLMDVTGSKNWLWSQPSKRFDAFAIPTRVASGPPTGVAACGAFLSTQLASLVAASASARCVASLATQAFGDLGLGGLRGADVFRVDWPAVARGSNKVSTVIISDFYRELRHENWSISRVAQLADMVIDRLGEVTDKSHEKAHQPDHSQRFTTVFTAIWRTGGGPSIESQLAEHRKTCQSMVGSLFHVIKQNQVAHDHFLAQANKYVQLQSQLLNMAVPKSGQYNQEADRYRGPDAFLEKAIKRLNGLPYRESDDRAELASFVRDLHAAQGAASMLTLAFSNTINKLLELSYKAEKERIWVRDMEQRLRVILSWVEDWRRAREKLYPQSLEME